jgi:hypothetical protein
MAKQSINIGTTANDGTGETVRSAFDKVNDNFTELYDERLKGAYATATIDGSNNLVVDFTKGALAVTLDKNISAFLFTGATNGVRNEILIKLTQDSTGSRTVTSSGVNTAGSVGFDISTTMNSTSFITIVTFDGTTYYGFSNGKNFG